MYLLHSHEFNYSSVPFHHQPFPVWHYKQKKKVHAGCVGECCHADQYDSKVGTPSDVRVVQSPRNNMQIQGMSKLKWRSFVTGDLCCTQTFSGASIVKRRLELFPNENSTWVSSKALFAKSMMKVQTAAIACEAMWDAKSKLELTVAAMSTMRFVCRAELNALSNIRMIQKSSSVVVRAALT